MYVDRTRTHAAVAAVSAIAAAEQQPEGWRFVPDTILPGYQWAPQWVPTRTHGTLGNDQREGRGWPEHSSAQQYSAETRQTWQRSGGNKSTVDESLLCYGGHGDEEVHEVIHENFDEKECYDIGCKSLMLIMKVFEVVEEKEEMEHEIKKSVKDEARGTKRKQRVQHLRETDEYSTRPSTQRCWRLPHAHMQFEYSLMVFHSPAKVVENALESMKLSGAEDGRTPS